MFHPRGANTRGTDVTATMVEQYISKRSPDRKAFHLSTPFSRLNSHLCADTHTMHTDTFLPGADFLYIYHVSSLLNAIIF